MTYTLDFFVAPLRCTQCGAALPADHGTNMVTYIRDEPQLACLQPGDALHVPVENMQFRGYLTIRKPAPGEPIHLLQTWDCPKCGKSHQWAEVVVTDGVITSIEQVELTADVLGRGHYIDEEARATAATAIGKTFGEIEPHEVVPILEKVAASGRTP